MGNERLMPSILYPEDITQASINEVGGKARNLWLLRRLGFQVPAFAVVGTELFRQVILDDEEVALLLLRHRKAGRRRAKDGGDSSAEAVPSELAKALKERILQIPIPDGFGDEIETALGRLSSDQPETLPGVVSVRSSAAVEDRAGRSFAGQFESYLYVEGKDRVLDAVRRCWASAFGPGVLAYLRTAPGGSGGGDGIPEMAVILQRMVNAEVSGVAFSVDPVEEDFETVVISAGYGSCDGIVADRVATDQYSVRPWGQPIRKTLGEKTQRSVRGEGEGTVLEDVPAEARSRSALEEKAIRELSETVRDVDRLYGLPVDVEWAQAKGRLYLLQARAVTTLRNLDPRARPKLLWDNSNIVESYSGVTTPLTFTFASSGYGVIYRQFGKLVGDSEAFLNAHKKELANMLGLHKGRVYYNLLNWYLAVYYLPGFRFNKGAMESMMGVKESLDFQVPTGPMGFVEKYLIEVPKVVYMFGRILYNTLIVDRRVRQFHSNFEEVYGSNAARDFDRIQVPELLAMGEKVRENLMMNWTAPILTDCLAMVFMKLLKNATTDWIGGERQGLENDLLAGEGGIDSTKPTKTMVALAARIRADAELAEIFDVKSEAELQELVYSGEKYGWLRREIDQFRHDFGFRCIGELKLEVDSIREDPRFLFSMLKNYVRQPNVDLEKMEARERQIRTDAEAYAEANLKPGGFARHRRFRYILANARKHVKNRENMRFARTRIFGFFRRLFDAVGLKFFAQGLLDHPKDIYYLTFDEVFWFVEGRAVTQEIGPLARLRLAEYERFRSQQVPDRFSTHGVTYAPGNEPREAPSSAGEEELQFGSNGGRQLKGVSCCPGVVHGKVRVIHDAADDMNLRGEILVAPRTDPGWVPLFPSASGLLIESGSVLSHSAIVARELGIPAIVGIKGLVKAVEDGQVVRMDGGQGLVEIEPADEASESGGEPAP